MSKEEFERAFKEYHSARVILETGMPQATEHERRAAQKRFETLEKKLYDAPYYVHKDGSVRIKGFATRWLQGVSFKG